MTDPLILFTGLPGAGVSTRMAALRAALSQDNGFRGYEVDKDGRPTSHDKRMSEFELLDIMGRHGEVAGSSRTSLRPVFRLGIEAGTHKNWVEVWEQGWHEAISSLKRGAYDPDGIIISLPIQTQRNADTAKQLDALIQPLRQEYWIDFGKRKAPWIVFDLVRYESLFAQLVPEMLPEIRAGNSASCSTPLWVAARREIQELAVRSFCQGWLGDNEFTLLVNAERQRCSGPHRPRVMIQVSSSWGFLAGSSGPAARQPANCDHRDENARNQYRPRFPRFAERERMALAMLKLGMPVTSISDDEDARTAVEKQAEKFFLIWKPIGIVEPVPSIVWNRPAPNMFWAPEVMSSKPGR